MFVYFENIFIRGSFSKNNTKAKLRSNMELLCLESRVVPATFTVLNTNDSGGIRFGRLYSMPTQLRAMTSLISLLVPAAVPIPSLWLPLCPALQVLVPQALSPLQARALPRLPLMLT